MSVQISAKIEQELRKLARRERREEKQLLRQRKKEHALDGCDPDAPELKPEVLQDRRRALLQEIAVAANEIKQIDLRLEVLRKPGA